MTFLTIMNCHTVSTLVAAKSAMVDRTAIFDDEVILLILWQCKSIIHA